MSRPNPDSIKAELVALRKLRNQHEEDLASVRSQITYKEKSLKEVLRVQRRTERRTAIENGTYRPRQKKPAAKPARELKLHPATASRRGRGARGRSPSEETSCTSCSNGSDAEDDELGEDDGVETDEDAEPSRTGTSLLRAGRRVEQPTRRQEQKSTRHQHGVRRAATETGGGGKSGRKSGTVIGKQRSARDLDLDCFGEESEEGDLGLDTPRKDLKKKSKSKRVLRPTSTSVPAASTSSTGKRQRQLLLPVDEEDDLLAPSPKQKIRRRPQQQTAGAAVCATATSSTGTHQPRRVLTTDEENELFGEPLSDLRIRRQTQKLLLKLRAEEAEQERKDEEFARELQAFLNAEDEEDHGGGSAAAAEAAEDDVEELAQGGEPAAPEPAQNVFEEELQARGLWPVAENGEEIDEALASGSGQPDVSPVVGTASQRESSSSTESSSSSSEEEGDDNQQVVAEEAEKNQEEK